MSKHDNFMIVFLIFMLQELAELTERFRTFAAMVRKVWDGWTPIPDGQQEHQSGIFAGFVVSTRTHLATNSARKVPGGGGVLRLPRAADLQMDVQFIWIRIRKLLATFGTLKRPNITRGRATRLSPTQSLKREQPSPFLH
jgi:hypothetical protein